MIYLESDNLYIKEIRIEELTDYVMSWFKDEQLMRYYTNSRRIITKDTLLESINQGRSDKTNYTYGIYYKKTRNLIGTLKLGPINHVHKISDLVVLIGDRNFLGRGLASEAIKLGNTLAFDYYDIRKLYGGMYASNIPSIKAYLRAGWIAEGVLKGFYLVNGQNEDRLLVSCFNTKYFKINELDYLVENQANILNNLQAAIKFKQAK